MSVLVDLTRKLGLLQTVSKSTAREWAQRTRQLANNGKLWDEAAMTAAEVFPAEFNPTRHDYGSQNGSVQALLDAIEKEGKALCQGSTPIRSWDGNRCAGR